MKNRQYSARVYETTIENDEEFINFIKIKSVLLKNNIIFLRGEVSEKIKLLLKSLSLDFIINPHLSKSYKQNISVDDNLKQDSNTNQNNIEEIERYKKELIQNRILLNNKDKNSVKNNITIIDKIIRSGRKLNIAGDLILFARVNSGASIYIDGNFIATQNIEGKILCNGLFMLFSSSSKAYIEFHGIELKSSQLNNKLNRVEFKNNEIIIKPVVKEEINWAIL